MTGKTPCGGLLERGNLCLVEILGFDWKPGQAEGILHRFADHGISLSYLSIGHGMDEDRNMSFCFGLDDMDRARHLLGEVVNLFGPNKVILHEPAVILTLYGPHFMEKPALASRALSALSQAGIEPHAVGSSVNSISMVVDESDHARTVACLAEMFDWPD